MRVRTCVTDACTSVRTCVRMRDRTDASLRTYVRTYAYVCVTDACTSVRTCVRMRDRTDASVRTYVRTYA